MNLIPASVASVHSFLHVFILNFVIIASCVLCAVFYPHVGNIIR